MLVCLCTFALQDHHWLYPACGVRINYTPAVLLFCYFSNEVKLDKVNHKL